MSNGKSPREDRTPSDLKIGGAAKTTGFTSPRGASITNALSIGYERPFCMI